ncbi:MAG: prepilin-type N-terminal cleavage/methylation domain-containing protein [Rhodospirillales bacterium]|nr:prepilin-type N-terminal cleavage/methylation domain-containing protein [Rhodospirillales bacterium]
MKKRLANGGEEARSGGDEGFTLLEVLIAFAILAIMLVPILQVFGGGLGVTQTARGYSQAALLARSKLAELAVDKMQEGESSGNFAEAGYSWQATVNADNSDVTLPDNTVVGIPPKKSGTGERRRPGSSGTSGGGSAPSSSRSGLGQSRSGFGSGSSSSSGFGAGSSRSGFGSGSSSSGFGSGSSRGGFGAGSSRNGFGSGSSRSGFGSSSGSASATARSGSTFGFNRPPSGTQSPAAGGGEDADGDATTKLLVYRLTVTVKWGDASSGNGAVTLTTLRLVQPEEPGARAE